MFEVAVTSKPMSSDEIAPPQTAYWGATLQEIIKALLAWRIWGITAIDDVVGRYRRTMLGPLWITLGQAGFIGGLYLLRSKFSDENINYLVYLSASISTWGLLAAFIVDGANSLIRAKGFVESFPIPMAIHTVRSVAGAFISYAHLMIVYIVVVAFSGDWPGWVFLEFLPGLAIFLVFGLGTGLLLGPLGARFRDLAPAAGMAMSLMFVLTPVFWVPEPAQLQTALVKYNPFYYLLEVVRAPLIGHSVPLHTWLIASGLAAGALACGLAIYIRMRRQIVYWL